MSNPNIPVDKKTSTVQIVGLFGGILAALLVYYMMPSNAGDIAQAAANGKKLNVDGLPIVAAVAVLMGIWWMTEAIALPATALLPMVLFPLLGVDSFKSAATPYASDTIYLFMGGFVLALAMQKWNLHTRIALTIVLLMGASPRKLIGGFMVATGFLSMWVSNTATAVMMLPVGLSVLHLVGKLTGKDDGTVEGDMRHLDEVQRKGAQGGIVNAVLHKGKDIVSEVKERTKSYSSNFGIALMLGIAYAASIGSLSTIIGTPPNALLVAHMKNEFGIEIGFGEWMLMGLPLSIIMMAACWAILVYWLFPPEIDEIPGGKEVIKDEYKKLGSMSCAEKLVGTVFVLAALCWVFLGFILKSYGIKVGSLDTIVAMSVAVLLFIIPANKSGERLIDWDSAKKLPWDILLLFGGGLALSAQFGKTGLSLWIGEQVSVLGAMPIVAVILIVTALVIFLTEITSNTATAAAFLPVIAGVAIGLGYEGGNVMLFTIPVALAATCAFMLPVATPPNAIAYGSGYVRISNMIKAGLWLNIIGIFLITSVVLLLATSVFGISIK
ncbi:DASS family sodium/dicarboxylate symporter [Campylobacter iguaniorum]|uniref:DASS family sodium/dicarboxylate symporter n=1 Tax=Campylobacter iguaniorum TaxID=1244531 RepID=A0A076F7K0_9BACT|nr:DASS family sodium-coupled anion symporter [Campylobacter iguaniorum]AII14230.1 DASS family sodium/dicarboxylate symporter [Campylobacter iguaniorum]